MDHCRRIGRENFQSYAWPRSADRWAVCRFDSTKVRIGFPVTAELSSTTRERLRGVLVDARLGVTGKGYGAHGLSGHRPQREFNLPAMIERGSTIRGRLRGHAPGFPEVGVRA